VNTAKVILERTFTTASAEETIEAGRALASLLRPPLLLILRGDLGAGKTTLVKGLAEALGAANAEEVTSPTFTLVHAYQGVSPLTQEAMQLYHLDLYRLDEDRQLAALGIEEMIAENGLVLIEWGEKFPSLAAHADGEIAITHGEGDARSIVMQLRQT
jgi:tRNA threonylcarbamoyladenosine biosynthesis protein TsaE